MAAEVTHRNPGRSRRQFLGWTGLAGAVAVLPVLSACQSSRPLRVVLHDWPGYAFMRLALRQGLVSDGDVALIESVGMAESVEAMASGQVDAVALTLDNLIDLRARGVDAAAGLQRTDLELVHFTGSAEAAWASGNLDAVLTYQPAVETLRQRGLQVLFDSRQTPFLIVDVLAVRREALGENAAALRRLIRGHFAAQRQWREDPLNTNFALASLLGVDAPGVHGVFRGLNIPDERFNRQYLTAPARELNEAARTLCGIMRDDRGCDASALSLAEMFLPDYLPEPG